MWLRVRFVELGFGILRFQLSFSVAEHGIYVTVLDYDCVPYRPLWQSQ